MQDVSNFLKPLLNNDSFTTLPLAGDASSRRYYRVVSGEATWVLMEWDPFESPETFPFLSVLQYFHANTIPVPKVLGYDAKKGLFLLEDLGDLTLERKFWEFQNQENIIPYYESTIDELIKIHRLAFQSPRPSCTAYDIEFSKEKLLWEFHYMKKHLIQDKFGQTLDPLFDKDLEHEFESLCERLAELPQVICHRDFHSRNVMIKHGKIQIIDFQDARLGPAVYDLVSLLLDSYVTLSPPTISHLLDYYCSHFPEWSQITKDRESFQREFDLQAIQRCLKACGSFASFFNMRNDDRYLKHIPRTLEIVNAKLTRFPEFAAIKDLLEMTKDQWLIK